VASVATVDSARTAVAAPARGSVPVTAIIGSHNEAELLRRCLPSVGFCAEVIVIDIDSQDDTAAVAERNGARVLRHDWVPIAERARLELVGEASHEWLLFLDPDEVLAPALATQIATLVPGLAADVAVVDCPWQFYFRGRSLRGTIWGDVTRKRTLARRGAADLRPTVHSGTRVPAGYRAVDIPFSGDNAIAHYWATGYRSLIAKHWRYLTLEGRDRYEQGMITGYRDILRTPFPKFYESFVTRRGYRDGLTGFALSLVWAAYSTGAKVALLRELRLVSARRGRGGPDTTVGDRGR
jgi:glycosyltransferase involved in cell wall biosynthesis